MYPNLYYVFKDFFGVEWHGLSILNTFGLMVALAFVAAAVTLSSELKRKEKLGLLLPREEVITVGKPASLTDIFINIVTGFVFGYKLIGILFSRPPEINPQEYIFSSAGSILGGIAGAILLGSLKWYDKNKQKLKTPERRTVRIWPHDRVGDIIILGLIFGILGAKLFDSVENWDSFIKNPVQTILSGSGLTFYGGLILASIAICWYGTKKGIKIRYLVDAAAPALMIAYAIGRIGCQIAGDGDWGIFNSAYSSDDNGKVYKAAPGDFEKRLKENERYFTEGYIKTPEGKWEYSTDRTYGALDSVPRKSFSAPAFLPDWLFAYTYPQNVNKDGVVIPGIADEHKYVLPAPVYPTPIYEIIICTLLFLFMWSVRRKIHTPMVMFGLYLILNGTERFFIELIRVNKTYNFFGFKTTQSELIALGLILAGILVILYAKNRYKLQQTSN